jgi:hypothetical protein
MMPRQVNTKPNEAHTRYGFFIYGHPLGCREHGGQYLATWEDWDTALAAAYCLRIDPYQIQGVGFLPYIEPVDEDWRGVDSDPPSWTDMGKMVELQTDGDPLTRFRGKLEADAWFVSDERTPICKVAEKSIHDFTHWRVLSGDKI